MGTHRMRIMKQNKYGEQGERRYRLQLQQQKCITAGKGYTIVKRIPKNYKKVQFKNVTKIERASIYDIINDILKSVHFTQDHEDNVSSLLWDKGAERGTHVNTKESGPTSTALWLSTPALEVPRLLWNLQQLTR